MQAVFPWIVFMSASVFSFTTPPCGNDIYCHGPILRTVQMASLYPDSKTFVDMKIKTSVAAVKSSFAKLMNESGSEPKKDDVKKFVEKNFDPPGSEFERWSPTDWKSSPKMLNAINDKALRKWALELNGIWKNLGRKIKPDVKNKPDLYSIIYVPHPFIVPGGRFREYYYWDSYWVIRGLLESEMYITAKGMLLNFAYLVRKLGMIPNGGRVYYKMRSQPPLFIPTVDKYLEVTKDYQLLEEIIDDMENEFHFWMKNRTVKVEKDGVQYTMATYNDFSLGPRPESYAEDISTGETLPEKEKDAFYSQIKAAAESGWDFSTRWFKDPDDKMGLMHIQTKNIVPVDLNAILCWNARILSKFFEMLGNKDKQMEYKKIEQKWMIAINKVLWHEEVGIWLDYDKALGVKRDNFYASNIAPLWTKSYDVNKEDYYANHVLKYIKQSGVLEKPGGVPMSLIHSGEQWDYPNAWPPLQHIFVMSLELTENVAAKELAYELAKKWVRSNYAKYNSTNQHMLEKYDASVFGGTGGGGEYEVQLGFGWSNGVILEFLHKYGQGLSLSDEYARAGAHSVILSSTNIAPLITLILAQTTLVAGCIGAIFYAKKILPRPNKCVYTRILD